MKESADSKLSQQLISSEEKRQSRGFEPVSSFTQDCLRTIAQKRGFAVTRLLTDWPAIVGPDIASKTEPEKINCARGEMGATLTLLTSGAHGPILQMQVPKIIDRVNDCFGFNAVAKIKFVQTTRRQRRSRNAESIQQAPAVSFEDENNANLAAVGIENDELRGALESLGRRIFARHRQRRARESTPC